MQGNNQVLGFRSRDQRRRSDLEFKRIEFFVSDEIGDRLSRGATLHPFAKRFQWFSGRDFGKPRVKFDTLALQSFREQHFCVES